MKRRSFLAVLLTGLLVAACSGIAVPTDKSNYVGRWQGVGVDLTITADGGVSYKRVSGSGSVSVSAPLQKFIGDDFVVGVWFFTTRFKVNRPPFQDKGTWKMVVEGVELTRTLGGPSRRGGSQEAHRREAMDSPRA